MSPFGALIAASGLSPKDRSAGFVRFLPRRGPTDLSRQEPHSRPRVLLHEQSLSCAPDRPRRVRVRLPARPQLPSLSRELNAVRGISGTNFEADPGIVTVVSDERIMDHAVYTLANPVRAFLVAKAKHWKSVSSVHLEYGEKVAVNKPRIGLWSPKVAHADRPASKRSKRAAYAGRSKLPDIAYIVLDRPPIMLDLTDEQLRAEIRERLALREREIAAERKRLGIRVLGWAKAVAQFFLALPGKTEEMFKRKPHFSASHVWERVAMAAMVKKFREVYASCRARFLAGERDVAFPEGTYFMRRHWKVPIEPLVT